MRDMVEVQKLNAVDHQEIVRANAPDCPSCERTSETHVVKEGEQALRGDGIYCGACETFITGLPEQTF